MSAPTPMRVILMRHGIAVDRDDPDCPPEAERPLTEEGIRKTRQAATGLASLVEPPQRLLSSPYRRALETARITGKAIGMRSTDITITNALLPDAPPQEIFSEIRRLRASAVMLFGHAPHLDLALAHALGLPYAVTRLKKTGAACLEIRAWQPARGELLWLLTAGQLRGLANSS